MYIFRWSFGTYSRFYISKYHLIQNIFRKAELSVELVWQWLSFILNYRLKLSLKVQINLI